MKEFIENEIKYLVGENAQDNWNLLVSAKKQNLNWLWFHLDNLASPYVVVCATLNKLKAVQSSKICIQRAGELCKEYSKFSKLGNVGVIYTELKHVRKGETVGQAITQKTQRFTI